MSCACGIHPLFGKNENELAGAVHAFEGLALDVGGHAGSGDENHVTRGLIDITALGQRVFEGGDNAGGG